MSRRSKTLNNLSSNWLNSVDPEEVDQEELIQAWKDPDMEGYQGMAAFRVLLYKECKEADIEYQTTTLKKNTPDKNSGVLSLQFLIEEYLLSIPQEERGLACLVVQPLLQSTYYGKEIQTLDRHSEHLGVSRSGLARTLKEFRDGMLGQKHSA